MGTDDAQKSSPSEPRADRVLRELRQSCADKGTPNITIGIEDARALLGRVWIANRELEFARSRLATMVDIGSTESIGELAKAAGITCAQARDVYLRILKIVNTDALSAEGVVFPPGFELWKFPPFSTCTCTVECREQGNNVVLCKSCKVRAVLDLRDRRDGLPITEERALRKALDRRTELLRRLETAEAS